MSLLGTKSKLKVIKQVDFGFYLDGGEELGELLLPNRYAPKGCEEGKMVDVFVSLDSEDRPIATTEKPYVKVGQCAYLKVVATNHAGAFMDWGMSKDLFVPKAEQRHTMQEGYSYVVYVYLDGSKRIAASSKFEYFLDDTDLDNHFKKNQKVSLLVVRKTDMGLIAAIDHTHLGLIHNNDSLDTIKIGDKLDGYIKNIRKDGKINLRLENTQYHKSDPLAQEILHFLRVQGGESHLSDKASAEEIWAQFKVSKSVYKKILGKLYKEHKITIEKNSIRLVS